MFDPWLFSAAGGAMAGAAVAVSSALGKVAGTMQRLDLSWE